MKLRQFICVVEAEDGSGESSYICLANSESHARIKCNVWYFGEVKPTDKSKVTVIDSGIK